ncbi:prestin-like [Littorina saxatilis]|uniref:prestin-like n=1 Tax=Littorina saxatilis TaxID=31220 RepID=UPI0038B5A88E
MDDKEDMDSAQSFLPRSSLSYAVSSTGSVRLAASRERLPSTVFDLETSQRKKPPARSSKVAVRHLSEKWSKVSLKKVAEKNVPLLKTLRKYHVSGDLLNDAVAGVTVGVMMIPQAMAFALVASLPPIVGLYIALFSSLTYCLLGTGHHLAWNCVAVLGIMMGNLLDKYDVNVRHQLQLQIQQEGMAVGTSGVLSKGFPSVLFSQGGHTLESKAFALGGMYNPQRPAAPAERKEETTHFSLSDPSTNDLARPGPIYELPHSDDKQDDGIEKGDSSKSVNATSADMQQKLEDLMAKKKLELACSVTFLTGVVLTVMGKLGLGRLASFMSDSLVISFTVGVSFHVVLGQAVPALGLQLPAHSGAFKIFRLLADIVTNLHRTNLATLLIFTVTGLIAYCVKRFVNDRYAHRLKLPVPIDLLVVIVAAAVNSAVKMNETYSVEIVKDIPLGVPKPKLPDVSVGMEYLTEGMIIILVSFTQTVALGKIMALKHSYSLDANQEMFSLGMASVVCSLFRGFIPGASITCTVVKDTAGGRTQIAALFSAGLVFLVVMFFGSYFYFLPQSVLASILVVNMRSMFLKLLTIPELWRKSRVDAIIWVSTCAATVVLDTDLGLFVGMFVCVVSVLVRSRFSPVDVLGRVTVGVRCVWKSLEKYYCAQELMGIKVLGVNCDFYFVNAGIIETQIVDMCGVNPTKLANKQRFITIQDPRSAAHEDMAEHAVKKVSYTQSCVNNPRKTSDVDEVSACQQDNEQTNGSNTLAKTLLKTKQCVSLKTGLTEDLPFTTLIIDFSGTSFLDTMGVSALERIITEYEAVGITVFFSQLSEKCVQILRKTGFLEKYNTRVFVSVDAVVEFVRGSDDSA